MFPVPVGMSTGTAAYGNFSLAQKARAQRVPNSATTLLQQAHLAWSPCLFASSFLFFSAILARETLLRAITTGSSTLTAREHHDVTSVSVQGRGSSRAAQPCPPTLIATAGSHHSWGFLSHTAAFSPIPHTSALALLPCEDKRRTRNPLPGAHWDITSSATHAPRLRISSGLDANRFALWVLKYKPGNRKTPVVE